MAKKCGKCGAELPEGAASCPACGAKVPESRGAALFTQMTAETEHWRSRQKKELTKEQKRLRRLIVAAALAVALAVFLIFFLQPEARVLRAIRMGRYEDAARIYWSDAGLTERGSERIDQAVLETAERLTTQYAAHELDGDAAARDISALSTIGRGGERLSDVVTAFRTLNNSQMHMIEAGQLVLTGNYLEAREVYVSRSSACKKGARSHVLEAIGLDARTIDGALRIGLSRYTVTEDIDALCAGLLEAHATLAHR